MHTRREKELTGDTVLLVLSSTLQVFVADGKTLFQRVGVVGTVTNVDGHFESGGGAEVGDGSSSGVDDESRGEHRYMGKGLMRIGGVRGVRPMIDIRPSGASERWAEHDGRRGPTNSVASLLPPVRPAAQREGHEKAPRRRSPTAWRLWSPLDGSMPLSAGFFQIVV